MPVRSFSPLLLNIFELVSEKGEFIYFCEGGEKEAYKLRARLHYLRREMRKEKHYLVPIADACEFSIEGNKLIGRKPDHELENGLKKALREQGLKKMKGVNI